MNFNIPTINKRDVYHDYPVSGQKKKEKGNLNFPKIFKILMGL